MKLKVAVEIEAAYNQVDQSIMSYWLCADECQFNDNGVYCQLFRRGMTARLSECIIAQIKEEE